MVASRSLRCALAACCVALVIESPQGRLRADDEDSVPRPDRPGFGELWNDFGKGEVNRVKDKIAAVKKQLEQAKTDLERIHLRREIAELEQRLVEERQWVKDNTSSFWKKLKGWIKAVRGGKPWDLVKDIFSEENRKRLEHKRRLAEWLQSRGRPLDEIDDAETAALAGDLFDHEVRNCPADDMTVCVNRIRQKFNSLRDDPSVPTKEQEIYGRAADAIGQARRKNPRGEPSGEDITHEVKTALGPRPGEQGPGQGQGQAPGPGPTQGVDPGSPGGLQGAGSAGQNLMGVQSPGADIWTSSESEPSPSPGSGPGAPVEGPPGGDATGPGGGVAGSPGAGPSAGGDTGSDEGTQGRQVVDPSLITP